MSGVEIRALIFFVMLMIGTVFSLQYVIVSYGIKSRNYIFIVLFWILTLLMGCRYVAYDWGGADACVYVEQFKNVEILIREDKQTEPLFLWFMYILHFFTQNPRIFLIVVAGIGSFAFLKFINYFFEDGYFLAAIFIFWPVFLFYNNVMRNAIAIALSQLAVIFLSKGQYKIAVILTAAAIMFHYSAVVFLVFELFLYICSKIEERHLSLFFFLILCFVAVKLSIPVINRFFMNTRYAFFADHVKSSLFGKAPFYVIGVAALCKHKYLKKNSKNYVCLIATYFLCLTYPIYEYFGIYRAPYFFTAPLCVTAADICKYFYGRIEKERCSRFLYKMAVFGVFGAYGVLKTITIASDSGILKYKLLP